MTLSEEAQKSILVFSEVKNRNFIDYFLKKNCNYELKRLLFLLC